ncbi:MAG: ATP synthase F1 subunit gamma [Acidobacteriota bacterium]|nr:ATP synthase F1 subunit gamma [Acidobacteriota bacterium]
MPSLIDIRRRIRSVKNTQQITKAMKMVSAAKLRRAQERVIAARPYAALLREVLGNLAAAAASDERAGSSPMLANRPENRIELLFFTSDKGLAGAFNSNLIKASQKFFAEHAGAEMHLVLVGRKGRDFYRKRHGTITGEYINMLGKIQYSDAAAIARITTQRFIDGEIDAVYALNNDFKSVMSQKLSIGRLLPVQAPEQTDNQDYIFEQPPLDMLERLLPRYLEVEVYRAMLETSAAEHAARMTAMDSASSNAGDVIDTLTLNMNRVRQAAITKEIIEVVSGASAAE